MGYEKEGVAKAEELEMAKLKMQARLSEAESTADQLKAKLAQLDKARAKLASDLEAQAQALDQAQILNLAMEKKAKQFDRIVGEWKGKVDSIGMDLDSAQKETRNASSELFRVKSAYEEAVLQLDEVRGRTRTSPTRSRTSWTRSARVDAPSTRLTKSASALRLRRWRETSLTSSATWSTPTLPTPRPRGTSRPTSSVSGRPSPSSRASRWPRRRPTTP